MEDTRIGARAVRAQLSKPETRTATAPRPRTWRREIITGGQTIETCPSYCEADHGHDLRSNLDDLTHYTGETLMELSVEALIAQVRVDPYSTNPRRHVPYVTFEAVDGEMLDELGPEEFAAVIAKIRAHCDRLDEVHAQLVAARAEYGPQATA